MKSEIKIKPESKEAEDRPEYGKLYRLTGAKGVKAISNGNTWKESEVEK